LTTWDETKAVLLAQSGLNIKDGGSYLTGTWATIAPISAIRIPPGAQKVYPGVTVLNQGSNIMVRARVGPVDEATKISEALTLVSNHGLLKLGVDGEFVHVEVPVHQWTSVDDLLKIVHVVHDAAASLASTAVSLAGKRKTFPTVQFREQSVTAKRSSRKGVGVLLVIIVVIVLAIIGANSGSNSSNDASYKAGFHAGYSYSGISLGGSNASYTCGQLWTQVSGNYNEGDWTSGCKAGINS
jgi:hypothetical protein